MFPVRVLLACLWWLVCSRPVVCIQHSANTNIPTTHTIVDSSLLGGQDNSSSSSMATHQQDLPDPAKCVVEKIEVSLQEEVHPVVVDYKVVMRHSEPCKFEDIRLLTCDGMKTVKVFNLKAEGSYCMSKKGSYKLNYKGKSSNCFNLSGFELVHEDLIFKNSHMAEVKFQQLPKWAKELKINLVNGNNMIAKVTTQNTTIVIPGNYTLNQTYYLWYSPVMHKQVKGTCSKDDGWHRSKPKYTCCNRNPVSVEGSNSTLVIVAILGVSCLVLSGVVAISTLVCRTKANRRRSSCPDLPLIPLVAAASEKSLGDILLVHAEDTTHLGHLCQDLKTAITKYCDRRVLDITLIDIQRLGSPEMWLMKVLSQKENAVVLVMSPTMVALYRALQQNSNVVGSVIVAAERGQMHHWDDLLPVCLKYLCDHLNQDHTRLLVVKFEEVSTSEEDDILELVPAKRFLLPRHLNKLLGTLGSCHVQISDNVYTYCRDA